MKSFSSIKFTWIFNGGEATVCRAKSFGFEFEIIRSKFCIKNIRSSNGEKFSAREAQS